MTTFSDVYDQTVQNTKRPELVSLTETCVRLATQRAHQVDFFLRDQAIAPLLYTVVQGAVFVDIPNVSTQLPRKRALKLLQSIDLTSLQPTEMLTWKEYKEFWDSDGCLLSSVYTEIGDTLRVRPAIQTGRFDALYYKTPVVTNAGYASWIADEHAEEIAMWAAGLIWARTGFLDQARVVQQLHVDPFKAELVASYLIGTVN